MPHVLIAAPPAPQIRGHQRHDHEPALPHHPVQVRLILVDPKRVEIGMYEAFPPLHPHHHQPKLAATRPPQRVREMERRLKLLASRSVRNIDQYNNSSRVACPRS